MKSISATIPRTGLSTGKSQVKYEADGFTGTGCEAATKIFSEALGREVKSEHKAEYYIPEQENHLYNHGG